MKLDAKIQGGAIASRQGGRSVPYHPLGFRGALTIAGKESGELPELFAFPLVKLVIVAIGTLESYPEE